MLASGEPVGMGFVASLARPGGNVTGLSSVSMELSAKRLELLRELLPRVSRVGALRDSAIDAVHLTTTQETARALGLELQIVAVRGREDFEGAFGGARGRVEAIAVLSSGMFHLHREALVALAARHRLPAIYDHRNYV